VLERGEIVPDVLVEKTASDYDVTASDAWPKVRVRTDIHGIARAADHEARRYVNEKRHSATTLLEAIEEKRGLLCRVVKGLITLCPQCFEGDVRPVNRVGFWQVAREIGASEHRVTRVTANAYVATPRGLFHLRDCFHWGRGSGDGPELPSPRGGGAPPRRPGAAMALPAPEPELESTSLPRLLEIRRRSARSHPGAGLPGETICITKWTE
jgi:DNA-directed RNA polymerase specialized sigma54-like protein